MSTQILRAVILTALPLEFAAVAEHVRDRKEERHPHGTVYERGIFDERSRTWEILIAEIGAGNEGAAAEGERAIQFFNPGVAIFVGVAGGIKDVKLGDVVASTKIYNYAYGKAREEFEPRPTVAMSSYRLEQEARAVARRGEWRQRIKNAAQVEKPEALVQPIAAGSVLIASAQAALYSFIRRNYGDAVAVEMEGHGHLLAVRLNAPVDGIVIRGISDLIEGKSAADDVKWQPIAARHAAAFAFEILARFEPTVQANATTQQPASSAQQFVSVSGTGNVVINNQSLGFDPGWAASVVKLQENQHALIERLAKSTPTNDAAAILSPESTVSLITGEATRRLETLQDQLDQLEFVAAAASVQQMANWLPQKEAYLPKQLAAEIWLTVAEAVAQKAKRETEKNKSPDLSEADAFLEKAKHAFAR